MAERATRGRAGRTEAGLAAAVVAWGLNFPALKVALAALHPFVVNALRFTVSLLVLGGVYALRRRRRSDPFLQPLREHGPTILGLGALGYFLFPVAFIVGIDGTTAGNAALVMASAPTWTAVVGRLAGVERLPRAAWAGLGIALAGTAIVIVAGSGRVALEAATLRGNVLVLGAAVLFGAYTVFNRPALDRVSPTGLAFFGLATMLPLLYGLALPHFGATDWSAPAAVWAALAFTGAIGTGIAFVWWNAGIREIGPSRTGVYGNAVPIVALVAAVALLGEPVTPLQLLGAVLIVGGVVIVRRAKPSVRRLHDLGRNQQ